MRYDEQTSAVVLLFIVTGPPDSTKVQIASEPTKRRNDAAASSLETPQRGSTAPRVRRDARPRGSLARGRAVRSAAFPVTHDFGEEPLVRRRSASHGPAAGVGSPPPARPAVPRRDEPLLRHALAELKCPPRATSCCARRRRRPARSAESLLGEVDDGAPGTRRPTAATRRPPRRGALLAATPKAPARPPPRDVRRRVRAVPRRHRRLAPRPSPRRRRPVVDAHERYWDLGATEGHAERVSGSGRRAAAT